jgi:hypothetical protein
MPIKLGFHLDSSFRPDRRDLDLASASEEDLRYSAFPSDIEFEIDELDLSARWGWIPVLDFATALVHAVNQLDRGATEVLVDFTENEALIRIAKAGHERLEVRSTYTDGAGWIALSELREAAYQFASSVLARLTERWPSLRRNPNLPRWYPHRDPD